MLLARQPAPYYLITILFQSMLLFARRVSLRAGRERFVGHFGYQHIQSDLFLVLNIGKLRKRNGRIW